MRLGGRIAAAVEILEAYGQGGRTASDQIRDWAASHRFAGSGDRAAIGNLVFDALRWRLSSAWLMGDDDWRAVLYSVICRHWGMTVEELVGTLDGDPHAPALPDEAERQKLASPLDLESAPPHVRGDYPDWLDAELAEAFGDQRALEGAGLAARAPLDLRANTLKADRPKAMKALAHLDPTETQFAPWGVRVAAPIGPARGPNVQAEPAYRKGQVEVQDEGSQIAALLTAATPGQQIADICAGGGGKTLALAAMLANKGQIYAYDTDRLRLANIHERLQRAGVRNAQVLDPKTTGGLSGLDGRMDLVVADAPCTGTGVWRRRPDAKWRVSAEALARRREEQKTVLESASPLVKPGGRIAYITCSVLPSENDAQVADFIAAHPDFAALPAAGVIEHALPGAAGETFRDAVHTTKHGLQMTPHLTGTDGFYFALIQRIA